MDIPQETSTPVNEMPEKPKRSRSFFKLVLAFLLGAMVYAIISGVYLLLHQQNEEDTKTVSTQTQQVVPSEQDSLLEEKTKVSEDDLSKYVTAVDCTSLAPYAELSSLVNLGRVTSIDLYDGVTTVSGNTTQPSQWKSLPTVVDHECKVIKISDIEKGDRVNLYVSKSASKSEAVRDVKMVQKANL